MSKEDMEVGFTLGDQGRLVRMETTLNTLATNMSNLPCAHEPPICTQESRLASLETSRKRGIGAFIAAVVAAIGAAAAAIFKQ